MNNVPDGIPSFSPYTYMTIRTNLIAVLSLFLFTVGPVLPAPAQSTAEEPVATVDEASWPAHFGEQLRVLLEAPDVERQTKAMDLILRYARNSELEINFQPVVRPLFTIYERDSHEGRRLLALSALEAIGTESVLERLAAGVQQESSERVRRHTVRVLTVHRQKRSSVR